MQENPKILRAFLELTAYEYINEYYKDIAKHEELQMAA
jgi:hypothetical protein